MALAPPKLAPPQAAGQPQRPRPQNPPEGESLRIVYGTDLVEQILQRYEDATYNKLDLYGEIFLNRAFYAGRQWCWMDRASMALRDVEAPVDEIRHTSNKVRPICRNALALLASGKPAIEPVPATHEVADEQFATVSRKILEYVDKVTHWEDIKRERDEYRVVDGTACVRYFLNPEPVNVLRLPLRNPQTGAMEEVQIPEFELQGEVYSPLDFCVYPVNATSFRQVRAVLFTSWRPAEEVREQWPDHAAKIVPDRTENLGEAHRLRIERLHSSSSGTDASPGRDRRAMVRVHEYIELPSRQWPQGYKCTVACRQLLWQGDNPYVALFPPEAPNFLKLGCVFFRGITIPGRCWGEGIPTDLRPLQVRHNKIITDLERNREACGRNKYVVPNGVEESQLTNDHGAIINLKQQLGGGQIHVVPALPLSNQLFAEIAANSKDMDDVGMRPEIARGINAPQVRSADQMVGLQEAANLPFGLMSRDTELGDANVARLKLALAKQFYSAAKVMRIVGATKGYAPYVIRNQNIYTDISVVEGSAFPRNRSAWNRLLAELWQMGALVDANGAPDWHYLRRNMDLGGMEFDDRFAADRDNAQTENVNMLQGIVAPITPVDAHIVHLDEHELYLKRNPQLPLPTKQAIFVHMQQHVAQLVQASLPPPGAPLPPAGAGQARGGRDGQPQGEPRR